MKKLLSFCASFMLAITCFAQSGTAGDLTWRISTDTLYIDGKGEMPDYSVSLSAPNFSPWTGLWNPELTTVIISEGVTRIGTDAFYNLRSGRPMFMSLKTVRLPKTLKSIGVDAFYGCLKIENIEIPDNVVRIGHQAFSGTAWYENQPDGVVYAGKVLYGYKGAMPQFTSITVANGTKGIADHAFLNTKLTGITIPEGVEHIGASVFTNCGDLPAITLPSTVRSIGDKAFYGSGINSIVIPEGVTEILDKTFYGCRSLKTITLPSTIEHIGENAFYYCNTLKAVDIPSKVKSIGQAAFQNCTELVSAPLPAGLTSIGRRAFQQCHALTGVELPEGLTELGASAFYGCESIESITIPIGVKEIDEYTFSFCAKLSSINFHNDVTSIGEWAFHECTSLGSVILPDNLKTLANQGFYGCNNLTAIALPAGLKTIGESAFNRCTKLESVKIPYTVTNIGAGAFIKCMALKTIDVEWEKPINIVELTFFDVPKANVALNIPQSSLEAYQATEVWKEFKLVEKTELTTEPSSTEVVISWQPLTGAKAYVLNVYGDEERVNVLFTLNFDAEGQLVEDEDNGRYNLRSSNVDSEMYSYTIDGLFENTAYYYTLSATDKDGEVVRNILGDFTTSELSSLLDDMADAQFSVYPNPTTDIINVNGLNDNALIEISDLSGRIVLATNSSTIDVSKLHKGIYILRAEGQSMTLIKK